MQWIQFTRICKEPQKDKGFTITEVLVAGLMSSLILAGSLELTNALRKMVVEDQSRIQVNQNLRTALDLVGNDVRQAGERLNSETSAIEITNGTGTGSDTLTLKSDTGGLAKLPVCQDINLGSSRDNVRVANNLPANNPLYTTACDASARDSIRITNNNWPDDLELWKQYRLSKGGTVYAYIYDPSTNLGEFFTYDDEDNSGQQIHRANGTAWINNYTQNAYVTLGFQTKTYQLVNNPNRAGDKFLQLTISNATNLNITQKLANRIANFQVQAWLPNDNVAKTSFPNFTSGGTTTNYSWQDIEGIEVNMTATPPEKSTGLSADRLTLSGRYLPRNTLSDRSGS